MQFYVKNFTKVLMIKLLAHLILFLAQINLFLIILFYILLDILQISKSPSRVSTFIVFVILAVKLMYFCTLMHFVLQNISFKTTCLQPKWASTKNN